MKSPEIIAQGAFIQRLLEVIHSDDSLQLTELLKQSNPKLINEKLDEIGQTCLHIALQQNAKTEIIELLLQYGANPNIPDNEGMHALFLSCKLNYPADLIQKISNTAAKTKYIDLDKIIEVFVILLGQFYRDKNSLTLNLLLEYGKDRKMFPRAIKYLGSFDSHYGRISIFLLRTRSYQLPSYYPAMVLSRNEELELSKFLLTYFNEINDPINCASLFQTVFLSKKQGVSTDLNAPLPYINEIPINFAIKNNNHLLVKFLLDNHANPNTKDASDKTPLELALDDNFPDPYILFYLLDCKELRISSKEQYFRIGARIFSLDLSINPDIYEDPKEQFFQALLHLYLAADYPDAEKLRDYCILALLDEKLFRNTLFIIENYEVVRIKNVAHYKKFFQSDRGKQLIDYFNSLENNESAFYALGEIHSCLEENVKAIEFFNKSNIVQGLFHAARLLIATKDADNVSAGHEKIITIAFDSKGNHVQHQFAFEYLINHLANPHAMNLARAQLTLGIFYFNQISLQAKLDQTDKAFYWLTLAANQANPEAKFYLAQIYKAKQSQGLGNFEETSLELIIESAQHGFKEAVTQLEQENSPKATFELAKLHYKEKNLDKALTLIEMLINQKNIPALRFLQEKADNEKGCFQAQLLLAQIYVQGNIVNIPDKALYYFQLAAIHGSRDALNYIASFANESLKSAFALKAYKILLARLTLVEIYLQTNDYKKIIELFFTEDILSHTTLLHQKREILIKTILNHENFIDYIFTRFKKFYKRISIFLNILSIHATEILSIPTRLLELFHHPQFFERLQKTPLLKFWDHTLLLKWLQNNDETALNQSEKATISTYIQANHQAFLFLKQIADIQEFSQPQLLLAQIYESNDAIEDIEKAFYYYKLSIINGSLKAWRYLETLVNADIQSKPELTSKIIAARLLVAALCLEKRNYGEIIKLLFNQDTLPNDKFIKQKCELVAGLASDEYFINYLLQKFKKSDVLLHFFIDILSRYSLEIKSLPSNLLQLLHHPQFLDKMLKSPLQRFHNHNFSLQWLEVIGKEALDQSEKALLITYIKENARTFSFLKEIADSNNSNSTNAQLLLAEFYEQSGKTNDFDKAIYFYKLADSADDTMSHLWSLARKTIQLKSPSEITQIVRIRFELAKIFLHRKDYSRIVQLLFNEDIFFQEDILFDEIPFQETRYAFMRTLLLDKDFIKYMSGRFQKTHAQVQVFTGILAMSLKEINVSESLLNLLHYPVFAAAAIERHPLKKLLDYNLILKYLQTNQGEALDRPEKAALIGYVIDNKIDSKVINFDPSLDNILYEVSHHYFQIALEYKGPTTISVELPELYYLKLLAFNKNMTAQYLLSCYYFSKEKPELSAFHLEQAKRIGHPLAVHATNNVQCIERWLNIWKNVNFPNIENRIYYLLKTFVGLPTFESQQTVSNHLYSLSFSFYSYTALKGHPVASAMAFLEQNAIRIYAARTIPQNDRIEIKTLYQSFFYNDTKNIHELFGMIHFIIQQICQEIIQQSQLEKDKIEQMQQNKTFSP